MSTSFPVPVSGHFTQPSPMYPNQGFGGYNDPYQQLYNQAPGSSYPAPSHQPGSQQPMMKPGFDPLLPNGYVYPQNGGGQMMSPGMGGPYPQQSMRPPQNYYGQQQAMGQMPPASMQKAPGSTAMGPSNGLQQQNMMIQQGMNHIPTSATGQIPTQMKSPMPMPIRPQQQQPTQPQMNSPGMFAAPAPPRMKQQLPSPGTMHVMSGHPMAGDPSSSTANHMVQAHNTMKPSTPRSIPAPPAQDTPFTAVTHYEMPPAFPQYQDQFKKQNPTTAHYYDRRRSQLKLNYPTGQVQAPAQEPATFGFLPGQARYEEKFDRRNPASTAAPISQMNTAPMTSNPMLHRQMSAPGITSPSYTQQQQQMMPAPTGPAAKKTKRSASTTVEPNPPPPSYQANRMMHMGTFNNPNLKSPGLMPMNSPLGSMQSPQMPPSSVAGSNGMNMMSGMAPMGSNGMNGNGMAPSSMGMDHNGMGSHVGNGMGQSMSNMQQNGQYHDMRPPPQYSQMQMPSSSQVYNSQMQQRYGNGLMSPTHQQPNPSAMQQSAWNASTAGTNATAASSAANVYASASSMQYMQGGDHSRFSM